jgi:DNA ligase-1
MKLFTELYTRLDQTNKTNEKVQALIDYFAQARPADAAWALYFLSGRKPRQIVPSKLIRQWAMEESGIPEWLFMESRDTVGDTAETIALLLPSNPAVNETPLQHLVEVELLPLRGAPEEIQHEAVLKAWHGMNYAQRLVYNKLITGAFRVGISQLLVMRALSKLSGVPADLIAQRLMGEWEPTAELFESVTNEQLDEGETPIARLYPFHLAYQVEGAPGDLGAIGDWQAEWKWDGIRSQVIKRAGQVFIWSRGEELITERFPEIAAAAGELPDGTVLDGEILPWTEKGVQPFTALQRRIGRKNLSAKMLKEIPVVLQAYDLLEFAGEDSRATPFKERRARLEQLRAELPESAQRIILLSEPVVTSSWEKLAQRREESRNLGVEGFMLKRLDSPYRTGRHKGDWWKWKVDPYTIDAVLIYAQKGSGKRSNLFTDYTFAVWRDGELVPFAKAYSGLTDAEIRRVDAFVRRNTIETFGPVRSVKPELVFELAFEAIQKSARHKSGVAVRFPRISRWREDKTPTDADSLESIHRLLEAEQAARHG